MVFQRDETLFQYTFDWLPGSHVLSERSDLVEQAAALYSGHYGRWGVGGVAPGQPIRISPSRLSELLSGDESWLAIAHHERELVGYCTAVRFDLPRRGRVVWVSQLVVNELHRNNRIGTQLLYGVWQFSDCYAWGLATANPFAVRALETATRRRCRSRYIREQGPEVLAELRRHVPYLPDHLIEVGGRPAPKVNTEFFVDLDRMPNLREQAKRQDRPWDLGTIDAGQEWFACTFSNQDRDPMDPGRLRELFQGADRIWIEAYERMTLDADHAWHRHAPDEITFIQELTGIEPNASVLDVGCGDGRHAEVLVNRGFQVMAIDISPALVARARTRLGDRAVVSVADARSDELGGPFDLVLCLYDVLGSSADRDDDEAMLRNIARRIAPGGAIVAGVMNAWPTLGRLPESHRPSTSPEFVAALEELKPSATMETSGQIFDPSLTVVFDGVHYRKEQFERAHGRLPLEAVVRDRRYTVDELVGLFDAAGLHHVTVLPVSAGRWHEGALDQHDPAAKELLAVWSAPN